MVVPDELEDVGGCEFDGGEAGCIAGGGIGGGLKVLYVWEDMVDLMKSMYCSWGSRFIRR